MKSEKFAPAKNAAGRTPQGVRGLKFHIHNRCIHIPKVAPRKGCVD